jgi:phospholipase C
MMENHNWSDIKGSPSAPYINSLLADGAHCEGYINPPGNHPSEPNYLWLEAGTNFGIKDDKDPATNHQSTSLHLSALLQGAGIEWRAYQEDIDGKSCPLTAVNRFAPRHDPFLFFDDVTGGANPQDPTCIAHNRPYTELPGDLGLGTVARYNLITPNLCNDMHDKCGPTNDSIKQGDSWLATQVPLILASDAYKNGGAIFITWDESEKGDFPIGMIVLSSNVKKGYASSQTYSHSSTLRTMQEIFGVTPLLGAAADAENLSELFTAFP